MRTFWSTSSGAHRPLPVLALVFAATTFAVSACRRGDATDLRTLSFNASEVTSPDITVSPDGEWLIFTMLGKLFRVPSKGGEAEQLTFGPYYDNDPAFSPDGKLVAFQSDRDGSDGNIFVLSLSNKRLSQVTHEPWADRPVWSPDGKSLVYLQLLREEWIHTDSLPRPPAAVRTVRLDGGAVETIFKLRNPSADTSVAGTRNSPRPRQYVLIRSAFFMRDGRVTWSIQERDPVSRRFSTRLELKGNDGAVAVVRTFAGAVDLMASSAIANGVFIRRTSGGQDRMSFAPLADTSERSIMPLASEQGRIGLSKGDSIAYVGNSGKIWKIEGARQPEAIPFSAHVSLAVHQKVPTPAWVPVAPGTAAAPRSFSQPRLSADGTRLVFVAGGRLWQQVNGSAAQRVTDDNMDEWDPAFSPDGRQLTYLRNASDNRNIQVLDFATGKSRTVGPPTACEYEYLTWSRHGELVAANACEHQIYAFDPATGARRLLAETSDWEPFPQLLQDGTTLLFQAEFPNKPASIYRKRLGSAAAPEALMPAIDNGINIVTMGEWAARPIPNRLGISLTRLSRDSLARPDARIISAADGHEFVFTPDSAALLYVAGNKIWRQSLADSALQEIQIKVELRVPVPPPVLLENVRVLDFAAGAFSAASSLLMENGRIVWIGSPAGHALPAGTVKLDGGGRFAIPGLFDMHGHGGGCGGPRFISYGLTSVRNMGGHITEQNLAADRSDFSSEPVPRCFYPGRIIEGANGGRAQDHYFVHPVNEEEARMYVRVWKEQGAQFIKLYQQLPWPLQRAATAEARRLGLPVIAHGNTLELAVKGVTLGYSGLTHWRPVRDDVLQMLAAADVTWDPTLGISGSQEIFRRRDSVRFRVTTNQSTMADTVLKKRWDDYVGTLHAAFLRGVTFLPGTDTGPAGLALQWELEFFAAAGIPPLDVLRLATKSAAQTVGAQDHLGSLEAGKLADIILLDANPLDDIRNTQKIWRVFKGGWEFDPRILRPGG